MNDEILKEIEKLEELEKYEEIINIIENLQAEQLNTEIIEGLARAYANIQKYEKAIEILKSIEYEGKNSVDWNYTIGYSYYYSKDYKNSEKYFLRALELNETDNDIKNALLNVYLELSAQTINESIENKDKAIEYALKSEKYIITNDDKVKVNSHLAWIYEEIEDFNTAEKFLKNTIDLGRDDIPVNSELGHCLEQLTRFEEALEYYKKAMKLGRKDQWIYSRIGYICCCLKKYEESLEANLKAYELGENNILINSELGYSLGELQRFEEAITYYLKAKELGREDRWIYFQMGWSYRHLEKYDKALELYLKAKELGDNIAWTNAEIGICYKGLGKYEEALKYYLIANSLDGLNEDKNKKIYLLSDIAYTYEIIEKPAEALKYFEQAKKAGRNDAGIYLSMAKCFEKLNKKEETLEYCLITEKFDEYKNNIQLLSRIAALYKEKGEYKKTLEYLEKVERLGRDDCWLNTEYGFCLMLLQKYKEAIEKYKHALELKEEVSDEIYLNSQIGWCYRNLDECDKALKYYLKVRELGRDDSWLDVEYGLCYKELNDYEKALEYYLKGYEKDNRFKEDTYLLSDIGWLYDRFGKYEDGEKFLSKAYELGERNRWIHMELGECLTRLGRYEEAIKKLLKSRELYIEEGKLPYSEDLELAFCYAALKDKNRAEEHMKLSLDALGAYAESEEYLKKRFTEIREMINSISNSPQFFSKFKKFFS